MHHREKGMGAAARHHNAQQGQRNKETEACTRNYGVEAASCDQRKQDQGPIYPAASCWESQKYRRERLYKLNSIKVLD